jgi:hypothetical protein
VIGTTLKKLRYRPGMRVAVLGAPVGFEQELAAGARDLVRVGSLGKDLDLVQTFVTRRAQLARDAPRLKAALAPHGILWVCYPKGRALGTDLDRDLVRETAAGAGLRAVAVVAIDPIWSALRVKPRDGK